MNIPEFIGQAQRGLSSIDDMIKYFDHTVALYDVLGNMNDISMCSTSNNNDSSLKLKIASSNTSSLDSIESIVVNSMHNRKSIYNKTFSINTQLEDANIVLLVQEIV